MTDRTIDVGHSPCVILNCDLWNNRRDRSVSLCRTNEGNVTV